MKKLNLAKKTAYSIIAGATLASAAFLPGCNRPESVYGPPPGATSITETTTAQTEETTTEITSETFDTETNLPEAVYGPPEDFTFTPLQPDTFDPDENEPIDVYGPPVGE